ncbi:hypothetical protein HT031_006479 [Scenedesmus sp. PABB004]|nr:hypothetical protein HT031_006479 [Scenedesmus sp. PABB004]
MSRAGSFIMLSGPSATRLHSVVAANARGGSATAAATPRSGSVLVVAGANSFLRHMRWDDDRATDDGSADGVQRSGRSVVRTLGPEYQSLAGLRLDSASYRSFTVPPGALAAVVAAAAAGGGSSAEAATGAPRHGTWDAALLLAPSAVTAGDGLAAARGLYEAHQLERLRELRRAFGGQPQEAADGADADAEADADADADADAGADTQRGGSGSSSAGGAKRAPKALARFGKLLAKLAA